jgi:hypothetical protein
VLFTPPISGTDEVAFACDIANVSQQDRHVIVSAIDGIGNEVPNSRFELVLPAGAARAFIFSPGNVPRYCKFVVEGQNTAFRASSYLFALPGGAAAAVAAQ